MSHGKERKEKFCLNCETPLIGRYCHICGQENLEPKETVWGIITHFFNDITHFDGKFFSTVKYLMIRPGFLSAEYIKGRRARYLNPIRLYVFTSAFFFLIFFSLRGGEHIVSINDSEGQVQWETVKDWNRQLYSLDSVLRKKDGSQDQENLRWEMELIRLKIAEAKKTYGDTTTRSFDQQERAQLIVHGIEDSLVGSGIPEFSGRKYRELARDQQFASPGKSGVFGIADKYSSVGAYDSAQLRLPNRERDGFINRLWNREVIGNVASIRKDKNAWIEHFRENLIHSFPQILFFSLPFFALILKLVYIRRRQFFYVDHAIFTIHLYCATFLLLLVNILLKQLNHWISSGGIDTVFNLIYGAIDIYILLYLYLAMRGFYRQGWFKTLVKYFLVGLLAFVVDVLIFVIFVLISAISI